jgi:hypothetical protein
LTAATPQARIAVTDESVGALGRPDPCCD